MRNIPKTDLNELLSVVREKVWDRFGVYFRTSSTEFEPSWRELAEGIAYFHRRHPRVYGVGAVMALGGEFRLPCTGVFGTVSLYWSGDAAPRCYLESSPAYTYIPNGDHGCRLNDDYIVYNPAVTYKGERVVVTRILPEPKHGSILKKPYYDFRYPWVRPILEARTERLIEELKQGGFPLPPCKEPCVFRFLMRPNKYFPNLAIVELDTDGTVFLLFRHVGFLTRTYAHEVAPTWSTHYKDGRIPLHNPLGRLLSALPSPQKRVLTQGIKRMVHDVVDVNLSLSFEVDPIEAGVFADLFARYARGWVSVEEMFPELVFAGLMRRH